MVKLSRSTAGCPARRVAEEALGRQFVDLLLRQRLMQRMPFLKALP